LGLAKGSYQTGRCGRQNQQTINGLSQELGIEGLQREHYLNPNNYDITDWFSNFPKGFVEANFIGMNSVNKSMHLNKE